MVGGEEGGGVAGEGEENFVEHVGGGLRGLSNSFKNGARSSYGLARSLGLSLSTMSWVNSRKAPSNSKRHIDS